MLGLVYINFHILDERDHASSYWASIFMLLSAGLRMHRTYYMVFRYIYIQMMLCFSRLIFVFFTCSLCQFSIFMIKCWSKWFHLLSICLIFTKPRNLLSICLIFTYRHCSRKDSSCENYLHMFCLAIGYILMVNFKKGLYFHLNSSIICRMAKAKNILHVFSQDLVLII